MQQQAETQAVAWCPAGCCLSCTSYQIELDDCWSTGCCLMCTLQPSGQPATSRARVLIIKSWPLAGGCWSSTVDAGWCARTTASPGFPRVSSLAELAREATHMQRLAPSFLQHELQPVVCILNNRNLLQTSVHPSCMLKAAQALEIRLPPAAPASPSLLPPPARRRPFAQPQLEAR